MVTRDFIEKTLQQALPLAATAPERSDFDLNAGITPPAPQRHAAVLVAMINSQPEPEILFTLRASHLRQHAGQISFAGGGIEAGETAEQAALRETTEETGIAASCVTPLGRLSPYRTRFGVLVTPVVAFVEPPFTLKPDPLEVAEIFTVPMSAILQQQNWRIESRVLEGAPRYFYSFKTVSANGTPREIWGATAGMLLQLVDILTEPTRPQQPSFSQQLQANKPK